MTAICNSSRVRRATRPGRLALGCVLALTLASPLALVSPAVRAQQGSYDPDKVVHLLQEPRHRTVKRDVGVILLDVQINPGDKSFPHTHNQPILITYISDADGSREGETIAHTEYASRPLTHVVENPGPGLFHAIAMVNDNPGVESGIGDRPSGLDAEPDIENRWFRSYRLILEPGESTVLQTHSNPTAIILADGDVLHVTRSDGITHELVDPGDWAWREAGSAFVVSNEGDASSIVVINEARRRRP